MGCFYTVCTDSIHLITVIYVATDQLNILVTVSVSCSTELYTIKPPNKGHNGDGPVVPCREVVLILEVFFSFRPLGHFLKTKIALEVF